MPIVRDLKHPVRAKQTPAPARRKAAWVRVGVALLVTVALAAAWRWTPLRDLLNAQRISGWLEPYRSSWYALPLVAGVYVVLGAFMISVLLLILATGVAFGPWLGSLYAMAGCLVSASVGFALGRWAGPRRVEKVAGERVKRLHSKLKRNGTLAVFLIRKVPAPYMLANIVICASKIRFRDFLLGTLLGMGPIIVALAGFGYQMTRAFKDPSPGTIAIAVAFLAVPLALALLINRILKKRMGGA